MSHDAWLCVVHLWERSQYKSLYLIVGGFDEKNRNVVVMFVQFIVCFRV